MMGKRNITLYLKKVNIIVNNWLKISRTCIFGRTLDGHKSVNLFNDFKVPCHQNDQLVKGFHFLCHMLTFDEKNFEHFFEKFRKKISKNFQILFFSETHFEQEKFFFIFRPNVPKNLLKF